MNGKKIILSKTPKMNNKWLKLFFMGFKIHNICVTNNIEGFFL